MAETKANKPPKTKAPKKQANQRPLPRQKTREAPGYWHLTDDEVLLRSPAAGGRIQDVRLVACFPHHGRIRRWVRRICGTITRGVSIFGSARTGERRSNTTKPPAKPRNCWAKPALRSSPAAAPALWRPQTAVLTTPERYRSAATSSCRSSRCQTRI